MQGLRQADAGVQSLKYGGDGWTMTREDGSKVQIGSAQAADSILQGAAQRRINDAGREHDGGVGRNGAEGDESGGRRGAWENAIGAARDSHVFSSGLRHGGGAQRSAARREGAAADYDALIDKVTGRDVQMAHEEGAAREATAMIGGRAFSLTPREGKVPYEHEEIPAGNDPNRASPDLSTVARRNDAEASLGALKGKLRSIGVGESSEPGDYGETIATPDGVVTVGTSQHGHDYNVALHGEPWVSRLYEEEYLHAARYAELRNAWKSRGGSGSFGRFIDAHFKAIADDLRGRLSSLSPKERGAALSLLRDAHNVYFEEPLNQGEPDKLFEQSALAETTRMLGQVLAFG